jgi:hypothetical protein
VIKQGHDSLIGSKFIGVRGFVDDIIHLDDLWTRSHALPSDLEMFHDCGKTKVRMIPLGRDDTIVHRY